MQINADGSRFAMLHRWCPHGTEDRITRFMSAGMDGDNLYCINGHEMTSHYDWLDSRRVVAWARRHEAGDAYFLFTDQTSEYEILGKDVFSEDGHCSFPTSGRYMLTDTYPDGEGYRQLIIWDMQEQVLHSIGKFYSPMPDDRLIRCDLHPRWSRDGRQVCIDSIHEGGRAVYIIDISAVLD